MGKYTTRPIEDTKYKELVSIIRNGYKDSSGHTHRPNSQLATILVLQGNLGCRIGDIVSLTVENIEWDGEAWRLNLSEEKTKKHRYFIVPTAVKAFIDDYCGRYGIEHGKLFDIGKQDVWKHLRAATAYLGLDDTSSHSLRKMAGINCYNNSGKDLALTSMFYNHSNPGTTLLYLKRSSKQMDDLLSQCVSLA